MRLVELEVTWGTGGARGIDDLALWLHLMPAADRASPWSPSVTWHAERRARPWPAGRLGATELAAADEPVRRV